MTTREMTIAKWVERIYDEPINPMTKRLLELFEKDRGVMEAFICFPKDSARTAMRRIFDAHKVLEDKL